MRIFIVVAGLILPLITFSQKMLTLQKCIETTLQNNINLKQAKLNVKQSEIDLTHSKMQFLPSLSANANYTQNFGTSFDLVTFQRINRTTSFSNPSLNLNLLVFDGFARVYTMKQTQQLAIANALAVERLSNELVTNVCFSFLQIVLNLETQKITENRLRLLEEQKSRVEKLIAVGSRTDTDLASFRSQIATEQLNLVNLKNQYEQNKLTLLQLMEEDVSQSVSFVLPALPAIETEVLPDIHSIIKKAITLLPDVREQVARTEAASFAKKVASANRYPTLS
ncbi:MAG: TolC family protein, partial [Bacteroidia bacterium]|nr:TolC family protein [Bacteroidia bacterium]